MCHYSRDSLEWDASNIFFFLHYRPNSDEDVHQATDMFSLLLRNRRSPTPSLPRPSRNGETSCQGSFLSDCERLATGSQPSQKPAASTYKSGRIPWVSHTNLLTQTV